MSVEAEQGVLGAIIDKPELFPLVRDCLVQEDFLDPAHRDIFEAISRLSEKDGKFDPLTINSEIESVGKKTAGPSFLMNLADNTVASNCEQYMEIVKADSLRNQLYYSALEISEKAKAPGFPIEELLEFAENNIGQISNKHIGQQLTSFDQVIKEEIQEIEKISSFYAKNGKKLSGVSTGLIDLDKMTNGFQKADLILLAARPSVGKSALAVDIALHAGSQLKGTDKKILFFSIEMSRSKIVRRMFGNKANLNTIRLDTGELSPDDWNRLTEAAAGIIDYPILIDDSSRITPLEIKAKCRRVKNVSLVIIDYLQLVTPSKRERSREEEVSKISKSLKAMAKDMNIPVLGLAS